MEKENKEQIEAIWNLRNTVQPLSEDVKQKIRKIQQEVPDASFKKAPVTWRGGYQKNTMHPPRMQQQLQQHQQHQKAPVPYQKYQSLFKKPDQPVEEKILNNIILSKLNKFSSETFADIEQFLCQILDSGETAFIKDFMMLVFKKAAAEEVFCPLYAKLLSNLSKKYVQLLVELNVLYKSYLTIFEEINEVDADSSNNQTIIKLNSEKMYRRGYSQFLAELVAKEILNKDNIIEVFKKLVGLIQQFIKENDKKALVDEYSDCLLRISRVVKSTAVYKETRVILIKECAEDLRLFTKTDPAFKSLTSRSRFQCMEILENIS